MEDRGAPRAFRPYRISRRTLQAYWVREQLRKGTAFQLFLLFLCVLIAVLAYVTPAGAEDRWFPVAAFFVALAVLGTVYFSILALVLAITFMGRHQRRVVMQERTGGFDARGIRFVYPGGSGEVGWRSLMGAERFLDAWMLDTGAPVKIAVPLSALETEEDQRAFATYLRRAGVIGDDQLRIEGGVLPGIELAEVEARPLARAEGEVASLPFRIPIEDLSAALARRANTGWWKRAAVIYVLLGAVAFFLPLYLAAVLAILLGVVIWAMVRDRARGFRRQFRSAKSRAYFDRRLVVVMTATGLRLVESAERELEIAWDLIDAAQRSREVVVLWSEGTVRLVFVLTAFPDPADRRRLLQNLVDRGLMSERDAFPDSIA